MATFTVQRITLSGLNPSYSAVSATDRGPVGPGVIYHVKNAGGSPDTVAVADVWSQGPSGAAAFTPSLSVAIAAAGERFIGPIVEGRFANVDGLGATITHTFTTSVTMAALST